METRPESPRPQGAPRWVAMYRRPAEQTWRAAAESPHRSPVLHALGEMTQTLRARGDEVAFALWGPKDGDWHRFDTPLKQAASPRPEPEASAAEPTILAERMTARRHQVLMSGLSRAGLYDLSPEDDATVQALAERLDEAAVRRVAHWLAVAGAR
ncbi:MULTISPECIES: hypothetical protein [Streptomyces]|uniref:Uncharacterized protein n=1 Tax=Streptomyces chartreusis NRRL 3882 TaxID=1079985 RepID=A0A2N9BBG4_STRCX|nr:hypothetical protein [Streptomyces chartreusis]MYS91571.1 hypothetical protein [Streptomyces sp. SID5464]SOR80688.1 hypothetical protein SCNRRL3882_4142 [Streptomyces chartreusis NRRL 3882]